MLQTQAMMNVTGKERYGVIPDEIIRYAIGKFGRPNVPIDPEVMDRIMANPRTKELEAETGMAELSDLRKRIGTNLSDEEFLLRATMPAEPGRRDAEGRPGAARIRSLDGRGDEPAARRAGAHATSTEFA